MFQQPPRSTLFLHDALPISPQRSNARDRVDVILAITHQNAETGHLIARLRASRSEEHTSELQSRFDLVCRLLLEKKKTDVEDDAPVSQRPVSRPHVVVYHLV